MDQTKLQRAAVNLKVALECFTEIRQLLTSFLETTDPAEREQALQKLVTTMQDSLGRAALFATTAHQTLQDEHCSVSLHEKVGLRVGRLHLIVAALLDVARAYHDPDAVDYPLDALMGLAGDYGESWLDETADLLKEWYNRRAGP